MSDDHMSTDGTKNGDMTEYITKISWYNLEIIRGYAMIPENSLLNTVPKVTQISRSVSAAWKNEKMPWMVIIQGHWYTKGYAHCN